MTKEASTTTTTVVQRRSSRSPKSKVVVSPPIQKTTSQHTKVKKKTATPAKYTKKKRTSTTTKDDKGVLVLAERKEQFWEIESIVGRRVVKRNQIQYLVRWKGCTPDDDTWEPAENLCDSAYQEALQYDAKLAADAGDSTTTEAVLTTPVHTPTHTKKKISRKMVSVDATTGGGQGEADPKALETDVLVGGEEEKIVEETPNKKVEKEDVPDIASAAVESATMDEVEGTAGSPEEAQVVVEETVAGTPPPTQNDDDDALQATEEVVEAEIVVEENAAPVAEKMDVEPASAE